MLCCSPARLRLAFLEQPPTCHTTPAEAYLRVAGETSDFLPGPKRTTAKRHGDRPTCSQDEAEAWRAGRRLQCGSERVPAGGQESLAGDSLEGTVQALLLGSGWVQKVEASHICLCPKPQSYVSGIKSKEKQAIWARVEGPGMSACT